MCLGLSRCVYIEILRRDPLAVVVLLHNKKLSHWHAALRLRLTRALDRSDDDDDDEDEDNDRTSSSGSNSSVYDVGDNNSGGDDINIDMMDNFHLI